MGPRPGLKASGRTVLLTTHYMEEAEVLCDRLAIMDHGRILEMGTVDELVAKRFQERAVRFDRLRRADRTTSSRRCRRSPRSRRTAARCCSTRATSRPTIGALLALTERAASSPRTWPSGAPTLEDVFLDLTGRALRD